MQDTEPLVKMVGVEKSFGAARALDGVDFELWPGECVGLVGHNGAGKSTLMNVLSGQVSPDRGTLAIAGQPVPPVYDPAVSVRMGVRCVFQELSLCPNLTVAENLRIMHPSVRGPGWRRRASRIILEALERIFPGHGIRADAEVGELSIARRQMVEIARAFTEVETPLRFVILDEPTSSLDHRAAEQLVAFVREHTSQGGSVVMISHLLGEILQAADRIVVMRDGRVVSQGPVAEFDRARLVRDMGSMETGEHGLAGSIAAPVAPGDLLVEDRSDEIPLILREGEIVGFAGLGGQGQSARLVAIFEAANGRKSPIETHATAAFVAGDRQTEGVFPLWSITRNISVASLSRLSRRFLVDETLEAEEAEAWRVKLSIRTPDMGATIMSLSGGNQQKALFARALGTESRIVLMDDPMRGVDVGTKQEVYGILAEEAAEGRGLIWYTTEIDELKHCHRVYVFRAGRIVAELAGDDLTEANVLSASFEPGAAA